MTQMQRAQTLDWLKFLLAALVIAAAVVAGFARLETNQGRISDDLRDLRQGGSTMAVSNRERIAVLETRLGGIENSQKAMNEKLDRLLERR